MSASPVVVLALPPVPPCRVGRAGRGRLGAADEPTFVELDVLVVELDVLMGVALLIGLPEVGVAVNVGAAGALIVTEVEASTAA